MTKPWAITIIILIQQNIQQNNNSSILSLVLLTPGTASDLGHYRLRTASVWKNKKEKWLKTFIFSILALNWLKLFFFLLVVHILIHLNRCNSIDIFQCIHKQRMECLREGSDCCVLGSAGPSILSHDEIIWTNYSYIWAGCQGKERWSNRDSGGPPWICLVPSNFSS